MTGESDDGKFLLGFKIPGNEAGRYATLGSNEVPSGQTAAITSSVVKIL
jgi:hypothetical protein